MRSPLAALLLLLACLWPARADGPKPTGDLARIQGTWEAHLGPDAGRTVHLEVRGNALRVWFRAPDGGEREARGEVRLDEAARPKAMDWVNMVRDGREAPDNPAIYRLDGDALTIRFPGPDHARPADFAPDDGGPSRIATFRRAAAAPR